MTAADEKHRREAVREAIRRLSTGRRLTRKDLFHGSNLKLAHPEEWHRKILKRLCDTGMFERKSATNPSHVTYKAMDDVAIESLADNDRFITQIIWPTPVGELPEPPVSEPNEPPIVVDVRPKEKKRIVVGSNTRPTTDAPGERFHGMDKSVRAESNPFEATPSETQTPPEPPLPTASFLPPIPPNGKANGHHQEETETELDPEGINAALLKLSMAAIENLVYMRGKLDKMEQTLNDLHKMWKA